MLTPNGSGITRPGSSSEGVSTRTGAGGVGVSVGVTVAPTRKPSETVGAGVGVTGGSGVAVGVSEGGRVAVGVGEVVSAGEGCPAAGEKPQLVRSSTRITTLSRLTPQALRGKDELPATGGKPSRAPANG